MGKSELKPVVLITGCSSGFGRGMVSAFLGDGWHVVATLRRADERRDLFADEAKTYGKDLEIVEMDVTSPSQRTEAIAFVSREIGRLDCLVNNAGYMLLGACEDVSESQLRQQLEINFFGAVLLITEALPLLRASRGSIINISSVFGFMTWPLTSVYCASKFALEGLSESLAQELRAHGVRVVIIEPGSHSTRLGDNIQWGLKASQHSVYQPETDEYRRLRETFRLKSESSVVDVARTAVRAARNGRRVRYRVGRGTEVTYRMTRWFPEIFGVRLMRIIFRRLCKRAERR